MAKSEKSVRFVGCEVSSAIIALCKHEEPVTTENMLLSFIEVVDEGLKVSFSWKEQQSAYNVSITMPVTGSEDEYEVASFWDSELYYALFQAYIVVFLFNGKAKGFSGAKAGMKKREKQMVEEFVKMHGYTPE